MASLGKIGQYLAKVRATEQCLVFLLIYGVEAYKIRKEMLFIGCLLPDFTSFSATTDMTRHALQFS